MKALKTIFLYTVLLFLCIFCHNKYEIDALRKGFIDPPDEAKLRAYWWWLNSMATKESITRDLEQMKEKGYGGAVLFDAGSSNYDVALKTQAGPVFGSDDWKLLLAHTVKEADRLGLELSLSISSGWNLGGPTVLPFEGQKKLVYSEMEVVGPKLFYDTLPAPKSKVFYGDISVQAFKSDTSIGRVSNWTKKSFNEALGWKGIYPLHILREETNIRKKMRAISSDSILNLTTMFHEGKLKWNIPAGKWTIVRYGISGTGVKTSTNSDGAGGLSLDHMSKPAFKAYFDKVVVPLIKTAQSAGISLKYLYTDSWEMGCINWTQEFETFFKAKRGYDPIRYLPVMTNRVVDNIDLSNRFLHDLRVTVSDAIFENHYVYFKELAGKYGLQFHPESGGPHSAPVDAIKIMSNNDFPMGEFWASNNQHRVLDAERFSVKQSACVAHLYGKKFVAAEGPTSIGPHWERAPKDLKSVFDKVFCSGVNRIVWHTFTSSPKEFGKPGNEYFAGTHLNPNATWWEQSPSFIKYINRCCYLLSRGVQVADVLAYYGDDVPNFVFLHEDIKGLPFGFDWDKCDAQIITKGITIRDHKIILPSGMEYKILLLPDEDAINLEVLRKVEKLVGDGMVLYGKKPLKATGLTNYPASDKEISQIANKLWGPENGAILDHPYGKGRVLWGMSLSHALGKINSEPDFSFVPEKDTVVLNYIHRKTKDEQIYFIANPYSHRDHLNSSYQYRTDAPDYYEIFTASFRVTGLIPEVWDPITGVMYKVDNYSEKNGRTNFQIKLDPDGSLFVIFRNKATENKPLADYHGTINAIPKDKINITGTWKMYFTDGFNAPDSLDISELKSLTKFEDKNIKYYSGHVMYKNYMTISNEQLKYKQAILDPGLVFDLADIIVNGKKVETVWKYPFCADIKTYLKSGINKIEIRVVNLWCNRLVLDGKLPPNERLTQTNVIKFNAKDADKYLRESGLVGPVNLIFY